MIEAGNPLMDTVRPVVPGGRRFAVAVVGENQTVFWPAVIGNCYFYFVASFCRPCQYDVELLGCAGEPHRQL